jgi:hypothetical protein
MLIDIERTGDSGFGFEPPGEEDSGDIEAMTSEGFILLPDELPESIEATAWFGPVTFGGGFVDVTSYCRIDAGPVRSRVTFYTAAGGAPAQNTDVYSHGSPLPGSVVGRRWRGWVLPSVRQVMVWWWAPTATAVGPRRLW